MAQKSIEAKEILSKYYYIIYYKNFIKPVLYPLYFPNLNAAKAAIRACISRKNRAFYDVIRGSKLVEFDFAYMFTLGNMGKFTKHQYGPDQTRQQRKSQRTKFRRRLRRMGMLTPVKTKYKVRYPLYYIKLIQNEQEVAKSPDTIANCFRLQRTPSKYYYLIISKNISDRSGILFEVKALKVDVKAKTISKKLVFIRKNDLIMPYLITELIQLYGNKDELMDRARAEGLQLSNRQQGNIHKKVR